MKEHYKLKGLTLLNGDIISPEMPVAEFSRGLSGDVPGKLVAALNFGLDVATSLSVKHGHGSIYTLNGAAAFIEDLSKMHSTYGYRVFAAFQKNYAEPEEPAPTKSEVQEICEAWKAAGKGDEGFWECWWPECPVDGNVKLTANMVLAALAEKDKQIEELKR